MSPRIPQGAHGSIRLPVNLSALQDGSFIAKDAHQFINRMARQGMPAVSLHGNIYYELLVDDEGLPWAYWEVIES